MSLASQLADIPITRTKRPGPNPECEVYAPADPVDLKALAARRANGEQWRDQQQRVDVLLGIAKPIKLDKFRYHWSGKCSHWDEVEA